MARSRNIKPSFFINDELAAISPLGRLLFIGLWTVADREGRLQDKPKKIKIQVLPYDNCNVDNLLQDLHDKGFILRYNTDACPCIQILNFHKHQNPHMKEQASDIPAPNLHHASTMQEQNKHGSCPADSLNPLIDSFNPSGEEAVKKPNRFAPPTPDEIKAYCKERNNKVDPDRFHDFYSSKGWMVGKNKMKDWRAAVRNWEREECKESPKESEHIRCPNCGNQVERSLIIDIPRMGSSVPEKRCPECAEGRVAN